jgi:Spy/CpxP family protein refolding chaperone
MWKWICVSTVGVAFLGLSSCEVLAQASAGNGSSRPPRGTVGVLTIVRKEAVQKELALTDDQQSKLSDLIEEFDLSLFDVAEASPPNLRALSSEERNKALTVLDTHARKMTEERIPKLTVILTPQQMARLDQIWLQNMGGNALLEKKVVEKLKITAEQAKTLDEISMNFAVQITDMALSRSGDRKQQGEKVQVLSKQRDAEMFAILTPAQTDQFRELKGKEFDLKLLHADGR